MEPNSTDKKIFGSELIPNCTNGLSLRDFHKEVGRFIYERATEFDTIETERLSLCSQLKIRHRFGQTADNNTIPRGQDLNGWILQDFVKEVQLYASHIKSSWETTGCSILLDGWEDANGRSLMNVLATCPMCTIYVKSADISNSDGIEAILEEVLADIGVKNVVQIISHNASQKMQEIGEKLMDKHPTIFWTVNASYCVELMIKKLEMMVPFRDTLTKAKTITRFVHGHPLALNLLRDQTSTHDLVKPSKIRSMLPFLTLENMVFEKDNLEKLFLSPAWKSTNLASTEEGKIVAELVADRTFWAKAVLFLKAVAPLNRALQEFYMNKGPDLGNVYENIDQVKEAIKKELKHMESFYMPFWEAIDDIWNKILHSPLHAAAYYLNPNLFYGDSFYLDSEVAKGFFDCVGRMVKDDFTKFSIIEQIPKYQTGYGAFGQGSAHLQSNTYISPGAWWLEYGKECPELQKVAIRILSQTCGGAAKFKLKRSMAERLHSSGWNHIQKQRLIDLTFVHYNLHLQNIESNAADDATISQELQIGVSHKQ